MTRRNHRLPFSDHSKLQTILFTKLEKTQHMVIKRGNVSGVRLMNNLKPCEGGQFLMGLQNETLTCVVVPYMGASGKISLFESFSHMLGFIRISGSCDCIVCGYQLIVDW